MGLNDPPVHSSELECLHLHHSRLTLAGHSPICSLFKEMPRRRAKSRSLALQKQNVGPFGRGIAEHLGLKAGPSGSALAVCMRLILLAVRGQIETKQ